MMVRMMRTELAKGGCVGTRDKMRVTGEIMQDLCGCVEAGPRVSWTSSSVAMCGRWVSSTSTLTSASECAHSFAVSECGGMVCMRCGLRLRNHARDAFQILGVPRSFNVDEATLERRYRALQVQLHPDKFARSSDEERGAAEAASAVVNESVATVRAPLRRAKHLLSLYDADASNIVATARGGEDEGEEDDDEAETVHDPELLMKVMEAREEVEAAAGSSEKLESIRLRNEEEIDDCLRGLEEDFQKMSIGGADVDVDAGADVRKKIHVLTYLHRIRDAVEKELENHIATS